MAFMGRFTVIAYRANSAYRPPLLKAGADERDRLRESDTGKCALVLTEGSVPELLPNAASAYVGRHSLLLPHSRS